MAPTIEQGPFNCAVAGAPDFRNKRVLLLFPHMTLLGGAITYTLKLAELLSSNGAIVGILTLRADTGKFHLPEGVQLVQVGGPLTSSMRYWLLFPYWQKKLSDLARVWQPDIIVPQVFPSNWWGFIYKKFHPAVKLIWVCHEPSAFIHSPEWINGLKPYWKKLLAIKLRPFLSRVDVYLSRYADIIIANSRFTADQVLKVYGRNVDIVAYPGVDFALFQSVCRKKENAVITVAHLTRYKRVDFLLRVFAFLKKKRQELIYHVVGDGDDLINLQSLARELGIFDSVKFHGRLSHAEIAKLNQKSLLFLHGSINETFGMAPLEAIACGTPVVAHRSGGPMEFVTAECGRLVDSLEAADWAREIDEYLDDLFAHPGFPERVRDCARRFDWPLALRPAVAVIAEECAAVGRS